MTSRQLTAMGRRFMRELGMHEWVSSAIFRVVRNLKDDEGNTLYGQSTWHPEERQCWIAIAPGVAMEETLIHEILHVLLEGHIGPMKTEVYDPGYELGLNRLARAYWKAWRTE